MQFQLTVFLIMLVSFGNAQSQCITQDQLKGSCINLKECPSLFNLLKKPNLTSDDRNYLRQSQCAYIGGSPWVCCPNDPVPTAPKPANDLLPAPGTCGHQTSNQIALGNVILHAHTDIVGGMKTSISEFPWMVLIEYTELDGTKGFHCDGVLINKNYILTAAHCLPDKNAQIRRWTLSGVRLGEWDVKKGEDCLAGFCSNPVVNIPVAERIAHEDFAPKSVTRENDIALLRLAHSVSFTDYIKPICLPIGPNVRNKDYRNTKLTVAGWGQTENGTSSDVKLKLDVNEFPHGRCSEVFQQLTNNRNFQLTQKQFCAGGEAGKDSCRGDSGGPLMFVDNSYFYVAGVVSFGPNQCGSAGVPGVYTRVDQFIEWITSHMRP